MPELSKLRTCLRAYVYVDPEMSLSNPGHVIVEGILNSIMVKKYGGIPSLIARTFQSRNNARVASLAMEKDTWREKLCAAFQLYGYSDRVDNTISFGMVPENESIA